MTIISYNHQFCFIHVPKCGGTSIEIEWAKHIRWGDFVIGSTSEGEQLQPLFKKLYGIKKHSPAFELASIIGVNAFSRMQSLAIVREPLAIIESDYRFALQVLDRFSMSLSKGSENRGSAVELLRSQISAHDAKIPTWWYKHHRGSIIEAILSTSFEEYLERVSDDRWERVLAYFVCDRNSQVLVSNVLKLEQPEEVMGFFKANLELYDFNLRWENRGKAVNTRWPTDLRNRLREICAEDYELFHY